MAAVSPSSTTPTRSSAATQLRRGQLPRRQRTPPRRGDHALRDRTLRAIAQGIFITDPTQSDEPISYVNDAFERLTGYTLAEVKGRDVDFLYGPGTNSLSVAELRAPSAKAGRPTPNCSAIARTVPSSGVE